MIRIALDAMGGDKAPAAPVEGALAAIARHDDLEVLLVGDPALVEKELAARGGSPRARVVPSEGVVAMDEEPARAMKSKPKNSARVTAECLASGQAEGVVNLGSTGAAVAAAVFFVKKLPGVLKPGIAVPFPRKDGVTVVVDCGGIVDASPQNLWQWAVMARHHARVAFGVAQPKVGILSVGEEEHKGNALVHQTWELFKKNPIEGFVGNVEGRDVFGGGADVVVCDGFVGNVMLKAAEGLGEMMISMVKAAIGKHPEGQALLRDMVRKLDYAEYGGAPLLGVHGAYVIGHGRSDGRAVANALRAARDHVASGVEA
jgi:glycerol-3-phosphate acyltransferase PlsX